MIARRYDPDVKPGCIHPALPLLLAAACLIGQWLR